MRGRGFGGSEYPYPYPYPSYPWLKPLLITSHRHCWWTLFQLTSVQLLHPHTPAWPCWYQSEFNIIQDSQKAGPPLSSSHDGRNPSAHISNPPFSGFWVWNGLQLIPVSINNFFPILTTLSTCSEKKRYRSWWQEKLRDIKCGLPYW